MRWPLTHQVIRSTKCCDCGQHRRDIEYAFDPGASKEDIAERFPAEIDHEA